MMNGQNVGLRKFRHHLWLTPARKPLICCFAASVPASFVALSSQQGLSLPSVEAGLLRRVADLPAKDERGTRNGFVSVSAAKVFGTKRKAAANRNRLAARLLRNMLLALKLLQSAHLL